MQLTTQQPARHPSPTTRASALAYLAFHRPDLDKAERFLTDFGLRRTERNDDTLYMRGTDTAPFCYIVHRADKPGFAGFGLRVETRDDLQALSRLDGASGIEPIPIRLLVSQTSVP